MNVLVAYHSVSGNTEVLAKAIHDELSKAHQCYLKKVDEVELGWLDRHDVIFVGSPIHAGDLSAPVKKFLGALPKSAKLKVAAFITHSSPDKADYERGFKTIESLAEQRGFVLLGLHECQARLASEIQPYVKEARKVSDAEWRRMMKRIDSHPNAADVRKVRKFARDILSRA